MKTGRKKKKTHEFETLKQNILSLCLTHTHTHTHTHTRQLANKKAKANMVMLVV